MKIPPKVTCIHKLPLQDILIVMYTTSTDGKVNLETSKNKVSYAFSCLVNWTSIYPVVRQVGRAPRKVGMGCAWKAPAGTCGYDTAINCCPSSGPGNLVAIVGAV